MCKYLLFVIKIANQHNMKTTDYSQPKIGAGWVGALKTTQTGHAHTCSLQWQSNPFHYSQGCYNRFWTEH